MKYPHSLTVLVLALLLVTGCDHKIELTGPVILKEAPKPTPTPKPKPTPKPEAKKIKEVCIGGVLGAKAVKYSGQFKDGETTEAKSEEFSPRESEHTKSDLKHIASLTPDKEWFELKWGTMNNCLLLGFQPTGEWVVLPGAKSHYNNAHYPPSAFMMFVKYEGDP